MDKLLGWIVDKVEKGELTGGVITVVVPGGIFSGELIPTWRFVELIGSSLLSDGSKRPNGTHQTGSSSSDVPKVPVEESEYLHLLSPMVLNAIILSNEPLVIPVLRIRIDDINAWTSGEMKRE